MRSEHLAECQLEILARHVWPALNYLGRLEQRMHEQGFPDEDRLYVLVQEAKEAAYALHVELHYLSCGNVGRPGSR